MRFGSKAALAFAHGFILQSVVTLRRPIGGRLGDRDLLDMRNGVTMHIFMHICAAASPAAAPAPAARTAFARFSTRGNGDLGVVLEVGLFRLARLAADFFEIILF